MRLSERRNLRALVALPRATTELASMRVASGASMRRIIERGVRSLCTDGAKMVALAQRVGALSLSTAGLVEWASTSFLSRPSRSHGCCRQVASMIR